MKAKVYVNGAQPGSAGSGTFPADVTTADLNRDGKLDVVTSNVSRNDVSVFLGNGDGTLAAERRFAVPSSLGVAVADVNGDGLQDVVTVGFNSQAVYVLLGDGDGTLRQEQHFPGPVGDVLRDVVIGDLNGDRVPDLAVAGTNGSVVWVLLQQR